MTKIEKGSIKELSLLTTTFWFWKSKKPAHDLIILLGTEPELKRNQYVDLVLNFALELGAERIYSVGGTYDRVPHTVEPIITAVVSNPSLKAEMRRYGVGLKDYEGPSSLHSLLIAQASRRNMRAVSLWGHAPHYIQVPNAKVCYCMLTKLSKMLDIDLDLEDVKKAGEYLDEQVNKAIKQKAELRDYVRRLEQEWSEGRYGAGEPIADNIIKEVENFLKEKRKEQPL